MRIGIVGGGLAAQAHRDRLEAIPGVTIVGCADPDPEVGRALADGSQAPGFLDQADLIRRASPDALAIFTPHPSHYRLAMDALQAGCHVFIEKPLSTNVQEAVDIVGLARGRGRIVGVGHQFRLLPSVIRAREILAEGVIGPVRLVTATMSLPWLEGHQGQEHSWRFAPKSVGGGMLSDAGVQLLDVVLWTTGLAAVEASAVQWRHGASADLVTASAVRLADGTPATFAISGVGPGAWFEWNYFGEKGRIRVTESSIDELSGLHPGLVAPLSSPARNIDEDFVEALATGSDPCCPADQALDTVRLLEAISRSATIGEVVGLV
ncbi:Gfo/Idh/MocA family protein [Tundrisphaera lichenicola]|uniref:Gfo/Idh/MocA family protein n=1 Tax=Tundrisphaera lichenicola TaxID=2029860 RepID=UPI003EB87809